MNELKMSFVEVVELVKREAKGEATVQEKKWLYAPANRKMWKGALEAAIEDCLIQFEEWDVRLERMREEVLAGVASQRSYETASGAYDVWRKKAGRYRLGLEQKLLEITLEDENREPIVDKLVDAIRLHKRESHEVRDSTASDVRLWSLLDTVDTAYSADKM